MSFVGVVKKVIYANIESIPVNKEAMSVNKENGFLHQQKNQLY